MILGCEDCLVKCMKILIIVMQTLLDTRVGIVRLFHDLFYFSLDELHFMVMRLDT